MAATGVPFYIPAVAANGTVASSFKVNGWVPTSAGAPTATRRTFYTDAELTTPASNPATLGASGRVFYVNPALSYAFTITDAAGAVTYDTIYNPAELDAAGAAVLTPLIVSNNAALTALTSNTGLVDNGLYQTLGRSSERDGGEGQWLYDSASTTTADGGTVLAIDGGGAGRFFRLYTGRIIHTDWFTQDQTGFTAAALAVTSGMILFVDRGITGLTSTVTISASNITIKGPGQKNAILSTAHASNPIFSVTGPFCVIEDLGFSASVTRNDNTWLVDVGTVAHRFYMRRFYMDNFAGGIRLQGGATMTIETGQMINGKASTGICIRVDGGFDVSIRDVFSDQAANLFAGVYITNTGDVTLEDLSLIHCGQALSIAAATGAVIPSVWAHNCFFDNSTRGLLMDAAGGAIVRCIFNECWFSSGTADGVLMTASAGGGIDGVDFIGCHAFLNGVDGIKWGVGVTNVRIIGGAYCQNAGSGVAVAASADQFSIVGARIGDDFGFTGNAVGISLGGSNDNFVISGNDLRGNTTSAISNPAYGPTKIIENNLGWVTRARGSVSTTTDGSGDVTVTHGLNGTPAQVYANRTGTTFAVVQPNTIGATTFKLRFLDAAGAALTATSVTADWEAVV